MGERSAFGFTSRDAAQADLTPSPVESSGGEPGFFQRLGQGLGAVGNFVKKNFTVGDAIGLAVTGASIAYQLRQARKAKQRAREAFENAAGISIRTTPGDQSVSVAFGYAAVNAIAVYSQTHTSLPQLPMSSFGKLPVDTSDSKFREYLLTQYVLCNADIDSLLDVYVDGDPVTSEKLEDILKIQLFQEEADAAATSFSRAGNLDRSQALGTGFAHLDGYFKYDINDPIFGNIPQILAFIKGTKVRSVSGTSIQSNREFNNVSPLILLEYFTNTEWGLRRPDDQIHVESFVQALGRSSEVVQGARSVLWNEEYPSDLNRIYGTNFSRWQEVLITAGMKAIGDSGFDEWHKEVIEDLDRHEFNGLLTNPADRIGSIQNVLSTMPGGRTFRDLDGLQKLAVPERGNRTAKEMSGDNIINESQLLSVPTKVYPHIRDKINELTVTFRNALKDYAEDSVTWPQPGSAASQNLIREDNGNILRETIDSTAINNSYHATALAYALVMESRLPVYAFQGTPNLIFYEPGDAVELQAPNFGLASEDLFIENTILNVTPEGRLFCSVEARQNVPTIYSWAASQRQNNELVANKNYNPNDVLNVKADIPDTTRVRQMVVTWESDDADDSTFDYQVEYSELESETSTERNWRTIAVVPEDREYRVAQTIREEPRCYIARVIPRSVNLVRGTPRESNIVGVDEALIDNLRTIDKPGLCLNGNWQSLSSKIPGNWKTAFSALELGLQLTGQRTITERVKFGANRLVSSIFNPTNSSVPDFLANDGTKMFLYELGGQIFGRALGGGGCQITVDDIIGIISPALGAITPDIPIPDPDPDPEPPMPGPDEPLDYTVNAGEPFSVELPEIPGEDCTYQVSGQSMYEDWMEFDPDTRRLSGNSGDRITRDININMEYFAKCGDMTVCIPIELKVQGPSSTPDPVPVEVDCGGGGDQIDDTLPEVPEPTFGYA